MSRIYILLDHTEIDRLDADYTPALVTALTREFSRARTRVIVHRVNPLALKDGAVEADLHRYQPDGLLIMKPTGGVTGHGGVHAIFYDLSLFSPQHPDRRIWRAQLTADGGSIVIERKMNLVAEELVGRLRQDRIIQ